MAGDDGRASREMTPKAAAAFAVYVGLGDDRSLAAAAVKIPLHVRQLQGWSAAYDWPGRIARAEEEAATAALRRAARKKLAVYGRIVGEYDRRTDGAMAEAMPLAALHGIHDRVKPPEVTAAETPPTVINLTLAPRGDGPQ